MPALPTVVTDYLTAIKDALSLGTDLGSNVRGAAQNYLRAQDMSTVLDLLQDGLDQTSTLTATGGTTTSVIDGAGTFAPGKQMGNTVTFTGNVTAALAGVEAVVHANDDRSLTFREALPAAPASGDTYTLRGSMADSAIAALRQGKGLADAPPGSVYGDDRVVRDALAQMILKLGAVQATATLTLTGNTLDGLTVNVGGKVYTFQATLTDVDGNVHVGASASDSLDNLIDAVNLGAGAGTDYATSMTLNPAVSAAAGAGDTMDVTAKTAVGSAGNSIVVGDGTLGSEGGWGQTTLTGGAFGSLGERTMSHPSLVTAAGSTTTVVQLNTLGVDLLPDQLRGMKVTISGESRRVLTSDESSVTLTAALSSAPSAATAVVITIAEDMSGSPLAPQMRIHPGQQPGENAVLSELIDAAQTQVAAFTLPT